MDQDDVLPVRASALFSKVPMVSSRRSLLFLRSAFSTGSFVSFNSSLISRNSALLSSISLRTVSRSDDIFVAKLCLSYVSCKAHSGFCFLPQLFNAIQPKLSPTSSVITYAAQHFSCLPSPTIPTKTSFTLLLHIPVQKHHVLLHNINHGLSRVYPPSLLIAALTLRTTVARPFWRITLNCVIQYL
jgi:hypothetical protein